MYLEKRKTGVHTKYFLVYSYRDQTGKVAKLRKYLGSNLERKELLIKRRIAEEFIRNEVGTLDVFNFSLTKKQIERLNILSNSIKVVHLNKEEWKLFTELFAYNTNAIEGSTVTLEEVPGILKSLRKENSEHIETIGVANAVAFIRKTKEKISISLIKKLHRLCFNGSKSFAGDIRNVEVVIRRADGELIHRGIAVKDLDSALHDLILWYKENKNKLRPLALAAIIHNQFEYIHPFQDGNGRVGRLLLNYVLLRNNYPPINISLEDRSEYYSTLQEYSKRKNIRPTMLFLIKQYKKTLKQVSTKKK